MKTSDFYYDLPEELIAQTPVYPRDSSRLMVFDGAANAVEHKTFCDIIDYLNKGDLLVVNTTKVLPVRLYGSKVPTGAGVEFLLLKRLSLTKWEIMLRPAKRVKVGTRVSFAEDFSAVVTERKGDVFEAEFCFQGVFETALERLGHMPLPPYIKAELKDKSRYNTVYAKEIGSSAAPTAGLHFTPELLERIRAKGVEITEVVLNVGLGTFLPVKADDISEHRMHSESYSVSEDAAKAVNLAKQEGRRIISAGTTTVRVLESALDDKGFLKAGTGDTSIFIFPGYSFKIIDALITNFHLPSSTLIMLVSALAGRDRTLELYNTAVSERYRFFSFGDAMFLTNCINK